MKKNKIAISDAPYAVDNKWRIEEDERRLTAAAEVLEDKKRLKAALKCMKDKTSMVERLASISGRKY
jgi:hypothetical protein